MLVSLLPFGGDQLDTCCDILHSRILFTNESLARAFCDTRHVIVTRTGQVWETLLKDLLPHV